MLRIVKAEEMTAVSGGGPNINIDINRLFDQLMDFFKSLDTESQVSQYISGLNSNFTQENNGWLFDSNNNIWVTDVDHNGQWDFYGQFDEGNCVFEYTDGNQWYYDSSNCSISG